VVKPKKELTTEGYVGDVDLFFESFRSLGESRQEWRGFLHDLLTDSEIRMIKRRWHIARLLAQGKSVRETASLAKVGTDTVNRVSKVLRFGSGALNKAVFGSLESQDKSVEHSRTPFIFGDVRD